MKKLFAVLAVVLLLAIMACSGGGDDGGTSGNSDPNATVLASNAKQLDSSTTSNLSSVSADGTTLSFSATTTQLDALKQDDVIISGVTTAAPRGLLKKVVSVTKLSDGTVQVTTTPAALTDAFQELHVSGTITGASNESLVNKSINLVKKALGASDTVNIPDMTCKILNTSLSGSGSSGYSASLSGNYKFTPDLIYKIDISGFKLITFKVVFQGTQTLNVDSVFSATRAVSYSPELSLLGAPILIGPPIPVGPVLLTIEFDMSGGLEFSIEDKLDINAGFTSTSSMTAGFEYTNDTPSAVASFSVDSFTPYYTISDQKTFSFRPYLRPKIGIYVFDSVGPYIDVQPYGKLAAVATPNFHIEKSYGIEGNAGGEVKFISQTLASLSLQLFDINIMYAESAYSITGRITDAVGTPLPGVTVALTGGSTASATTDTAGYYKFTDISNGSYAVTPTLFSYSFNPISVHFVVASGDAIVPLITATDIVPIVSQTPMSVNPGGTVTQSGTGFTPNSTATLHFLKPDLTEYTPLSQAIGSDGTFSITYTIPTDRATGTYTWWGVDSSGVVSNTVSFIVANVTISDGTLTGINGYNVAAIVNIEPNYGPNNTPINITVTFTSGASLVYDIIVAGANESSSWQFVQYSNYTWSKISSTVWQPGDRVLTGIYGVERFYAVTSTGVKIAVGDIWLNGSPNTEIPDWQNDGIGGVGVARKMLKSTAVIGPTSAVKK